MGTTFRAKSKENYNADQATIENITTGCLQRIADSMEQISNNYETLLRNVEMYKSLWDDSEKKNARLKKSQAALKGALSRYKNKQANNLKKESAE